MFFEAEREHFYRPLSGKRRELVAACLRLLFDRLHGPGADYSSALTRDTLRDLLSPVVQLFGAESVHEALSSDDDLAAVDLADEQQVTGAIIRALLRDGWVETFGDRAGLVTAYRFTRAGKLHADVLWQLERPRARTRQRSMRSCRNSLEAAFRNNDAYDLIDAYDHAERVIADLSEGVDYFQELMRHVVAEAARTPWDHFIGFLERFEKEFKKQLTADNVERHRQYIRETLEQLRSLDEHRTVALERQLNDAALWAKDQRTTDTSLEWMLKRIEEMVEAACESKLPDLIKSMNGYMRRAATLVQQAFSLRGAHDRQGFAKAIKRMSELPQQGQDSLLAKIGDAMACAEVRLIDPATFRLRKSAERRKAQTVTSAPIISREARLAAAIKRAEDEAFAISNEEILDYLRGQLRAAQSPLRLSDFKIVTALDLLYLMQAIDAVRAPDPTGILARRLSTKVSNNFWTGSDYELTLEETC
ncbi:Wadjet anti-phage system protein JetA family protein [Paraburkholderia sp. UCT31]|uniref:Wadjet anti-phage system protein JetA family protein n=1 Tax=Paraburkholderia sp. UCT31 TaxID=2615209 RepID=UPI00165595AC|nr:Wadjet anti-phage system protein JetA family protein [Paraburkholderia sp. UCT31]